MLNKIRKPSAYRESRFKKIFAYSFFALICFIMVLFMPVTSQLIGGPSVAHVGRQAVSPREFRLAVESARSQYQDRLDKAAETEEWRRITQQMEREALNRLINSYVLAQAARKAGAIAPDAAVRDQIQSFPFFQSQGRFVYSQYRNLLKRQNLSPGKFEERIRRDVLAQIYRGAFFAALRPAVSMEKADSGFRADIRFAALPEGISAADEEKLQNLLPEKSRRPQTVRLLKKLKAQWKKVEDFSPSGQKAFQFEGNKALLRAVLGFLPETGFAPYIIRGGSRQYIAEVLSFKRLEKKSLPEEGKAPPAAGKTAAAASAEEGNFDFLLNYAKPLRLFESHVQAKKAETKIKINERYFSRSN